MAGRKSGAKKEENKHLLAALPLKLAVFALLVVLMCAFFIFRLQAKQPNFAIRNAAKGKSALVYMEIADSSFARMRGLMFREKIIPILFVFDSEGIYPIHSNFVKAPFDAVYLSPEGRVVEVFRKIPPATQLVQPTKKAKFLLELPTEVFDSLSIEEGDIIDWEKADAGRQGN